MAGDSTEILSRLTEFVYDEARLIDDKRFDDWYELFTDDGVYWMPLSHGQPDGLNYTSLFHEDKLLLKVRIERLKSPRSFSQAQPSYCQHVLQRPALESSDPQQRSWVMRTPFVYVEAQADDQLVLAGVVRHHIVELDGRLRLRLKKVDLINREAALPSIQLFP
jgi:3-phenylpropionate/cinnamic acid dioxygenase small subunit